MYVCFSVICNEVVCPISLNNGFCQVLPKQFNRLNLNFEKIKKKYLSTYSWSFFVTDYVLPLDSSISTYSRFNVVICG